MVIFPYNDFTATQLFWRIVPEICHHLLDLIRRKLSGILPQVIGQSGCGFCAPADDGEGLANAVRAFLACEDKAQLGRNARKYYEENFTQELFIKRLEDELYAHCVDLKK